MFGMNDEPAHMVRAQGVLRGDFSDPDITDGLPGEQYNCVFWQGQTADCMDLTWLPEGTIQSSPTNNYPPLLHFIAGIPSLFFDGLLGAYLMRIWLASICVAILAWAVKLRMHTNGNLLHVGGCAVRTNFCRRSSSVGKWSQRFYPVIFNCSTAEPSYIHRGSSTFSFSSTRCFPLGSLDFVLSAFHGFSCTSQTTFQVAHNLGISARDLCFNGRSLDNLGIKSHRLICFQCFVPFRWLMEIRHRSALFVHIDAHWQLRLEQHLDVERNACHLYNYCLFSPVDCSHFKQSLFHSRSARHGRSFLRFTCSHRRCALVLHSRSLSLPSLDRCFHSRWASNR